jgi:hypothetical protein
VDVNQTYCVGFWSKECWLVFNRRRKQTVLWRKVQNKSGKTKVAKQLKKDGGKPKYIIPN